MGGGSVRLPAWRALYFGLPPWRFQPGSSSSMAEHIVRHSTGAFYTNEDGERTLVRIDASTGSLRDTGGAKRDDLTTVLAAVTQDGMALKYAGSALQANRDVVMAAVRQTGWALAFAARELRADREIALAAVRQNGLALMHVQKALQADPLVAQASRHAPREMRTVRPAKMCAR